MKSKFKIKTLENLVNKAFAGKLKTYILKLEGNKYIYDNNKITEYYESKEDFIKKNNIKENDLLIIIKFV